VKDRNIIRLYEPRDLDAIKKIFRRQNLPVYLPVPFDHAIGEGDPSVVAAFVSEESGEVQRALIVRAEVELHYITDPENTSVAEVTRMGHMAEGAVMELGVELSRLKFPVLTHARARVPKSMGKMISYMQQHHGFAMETDAFVGLFKKIGS
jgi:hypothetical protein